MKLCDIEFFKIKLLVGYNEVEDTLLNRLLSEYVDHTGTGVLTCFLFISSSRLLTFDTFFNLKLPKKIC